MNETISAERGPAPDMERAWGLAQTALGFVAWLARDFVHTGVAREDLESEGRLGLVDAALRFDPGHGVQFATYASWWARRRMQRFVFHHGRIVRRPEARGARPAHDARDVSLDAPMSGRNAQLWSDVLPDGGQPPIESLLRDEGARLVARATGELPPLWQAIVIERFGLDGSPPRTLAAIGGRLGVSRERVRQIESKAIGRLRERMTLAWQRP